MKPCLAIPGAMFAALALLASCATSRLVAQQSNPDYVGKSFKSVMVVAVTSDELIRRTFEDRMVALLGQRGTKGIPAYAAVGSRGQVEEADLRQAIARSGAEGVLMTRVTRIDRSSGTVPGSTVAVGIGWGGFYGYYSTVWQTVEVAPQKITGPSWTVSETRLFDAKNGVLAWTGVMDTRENDDLGAALTQYVGVIFDAMVNDRVL
ncbi:MAG: hypothetical protein E6H49_01240 [Betaproteobacteria bacterium]|jgi:hypothetical protein|nr:MAG: hypothetical protein E6H49_01240 [Betaproteobacteria bacterium]